MDGVGQRGHRTEAGTLIKHRIIERSKATTYLGSRTTLRCLVEAMASTFDRSEPSGVAMQSFQDGNSRSLDCEPSNPLHTVPRLMYILTAGGRGSWESLEEGRRASERWRRPGILFSKPTHYTQLRTKEAFSPGSEVHALYRKSHMPTTRRNGLCERSVEESSLRGCLETTNRCNTKGERILGGHYILPQ